MTRIPAAILVAALLATVAAPVAAAAPSNDDPAGATVIEAIPFHDTIDTSEATNGGDDAVGCGGPDVTASVWYRYLAGDDATVNISMSQSDYAVGMNVLVGQPGAFELVTCFLFEGQVEVAAGTEYWLLVTPPDAASPGGNLVLDVTLAPPPLQIDVVFAGSTVNAASGLATVRGTITCDREAEVGFEGNLRQRAGRFYIDGFFSGQATCTPEGTDFSAVVEANGRYAGGRASVHMFVYAFGGNGFAEVSTTIRLTGSHS